MPRFRDPLKNVETKFNSTKRKFESVVIKGIDFEQMSPARQQAWEKQHQTALQAHATQAAQYADVLGGMLNGAHAGMTKKAPAKANTAKARTATKTASRGGRKAK